MTDISQGPNSLELTILIPCLNEAETLATCIGKAQNYLDCNQIKGEVLIADNGSTDGSIEIARQAGARLVPVAQRGYGAALMGGINAARGCYVIMGDADDSYDFSCLDPFVQQLRQGYDLVMGNRFKGGIRPGAMPFLHRYLGNPVLSSLGRLFFHTQISDFHCGLRGFRRDAILALDLRTTGMEFASEMVVKSSLHGLKIAEVPTVLFPDGRSRKPHLRTWRDGWRHLRFLLLYSPRWLFLFPGLALMLAGFALSLWLLPGPRPVGGLVLDVNTLVYAALAIIIGFEAVTFALFTQALGMTTGLLPEEEHWVRTLNAIRLERGLVVGGVMTLIGLIFSLYALSTWEQGSFGPLVPTQSLRWVIPGGVLLTLGIQVMLSSFFLGILGLIKR